MNFKKPIEDILLSLKKKGVDRRTIESELGYKEFYLDQALSKGGNEKLLTRLNDYVSRSVNKNVDLSNELGRINERLIYLESSNAVLKQTLANVIATGNSKSAALASAELDEAIELTVKNHYSKLKKKA